MIDATKKPKNNSNNRQLNDYELYISEDHNRILNKRKQNSYAEKNRIYITEDSYIMNNKNGNQCSISKNDLKKITCLQNEKMKLEKKLEEQEDFLSKILKSELIQEQKLMRIKEKMEKREKRYKQFLKEKNDGLKYIENERYKDQIDIHERQKLYEKILSNYNKKINGIKKQNSQIKKKNNSNGENNKNEEKIENIKLHIKDYEIINKKYKQKLNEMFDLNYNREPKQTEPVVKRSELSNSKFGRKIIEMEEKYEIDKIKRESALMSHISQYQKKINGFLAKKDEKEHNIKERMKNIEKKREENRIIKSMHFDEMREKIKDNQKRLENERIKKLEDLEKKDLKDFAIKQEKIKMYEERKKITQQNYEEKEMMKAKLIEVLKNKNKHINNIEDNSLINILMNQE